MKKAHTWRGALFCLLLAAVGVSADKAQQEGTKRPLQPADAKLEALKLEAIADIGSMKDFTQQMVDMIFSFGELGFQEFESSRYLAGEIIDRLESARIAYARMNTIHEFLRHPQLAARNRWRTIDSPVGPLAALIPPATLEGVEPVLGPIPAVGEHTQVILEELGFDRHTINRWRSAGVV